MPTDCSAILLAGGQSSRMGTPKLWLEFAGRPLLQHLVERLAELTPEVIVVAAPGQELPPTGARILYDESPGEGPVAGLVVGLREVTRPLAFVASCDVPFLRRELVRFLVDQAEGYDVVVPEWGGRPQPLLAVYRTSVQPVLARQLAEGRRRTTDLFDHVRTLRVSEAEVRRVDPEGLSYFNMNTPEDYQRALALWEASRVSTQD